MILWLGLVGIGLLVFGMLFVMASTSPMAVLSGSGGGSHIFGTFFVVVGVIFVIYGFDPQVVYHFLGNLTANWSSSGL